MAAISGGIFEASVFSCGFMSKLGLLMMTMGSSGCASRMIVKRVLSLDNEPINQSILKCSSANLIASSFSGEHFGCLLSSDLGLL